HTGAHNKSDLQTPQELSGADPRSVPEPEMKDLLRGTTLTGKRLPSIRSEFLRRIPGRRLSPEFLAAVRVPDVENNVRALRDKQLPCVGCLHPGVSRRSPRQKIERGGESQRLFQNPV